MSTEQLTGLQLAVRLLAEIGDERSDAAIAAVHDLADERDKAHQDAISAAVERDALRARLAEIEAQEPAGWQQRTLFDGEWSDWQDCSWRTADILRQRADYDVRPVYARPVPAQAVPESVDGLVSVFSYDEVLTFTFRAESDADKFMARFEPTVDSAAQEHKA